MTEEERLAEVARLIRELLAERDQLIRRLRSGGMSLRAVAGLAGLSHAAVALIVNKPT